MTKTYLLCGKNFADKSGAKEVAKITTVKLPSSDPGNSNPKGDCKYCGETHGGAFGWLIKIIHSILALFGLHK